MDAMRGHGERGEPAGLAGVENLTLHFTPDEDEPVIQFSPALVSDREVLSRIAEITDAALAELERRIGATSRAKPGPDGRRSRAGDDGGRS